MDTTITVYLKSTAGDLLPMEIAPDIPVYQFEHLALRRWEQHIGGQVIGEFCVLRFPPCEEKKQEQEQEQEQEPSFSLLPICMRELLFPSPEEIFPVIVRDATASILIVLTGEGWDGAMESDLYMITIRIHSLSSRTALPFLSFPFAHYRLSHDLVYERADAPFLPLEGIHTAQWRPNRRGDDLYLDVPPSATYYSFEGFTNHFFEHLLPAHPHAHFLPESARQSLRQNFPSQWNKYRGRYF